MTLIVYDTFHKMSSNDDVTNILNLDFIKDHGGSRASPHPLKHPSLNKGLGVKLWSSGLIFNAITNVETNL